MTSCVEECTSSSESWSRRSSVSFAASEEDKISSAVFRPKYIPVASFITCRVFFAHRDPFISEGNIVTLVTYLRLIAGKLNFDFAAKYYVFRKFINSTLRLAWSGEVDEGIARFLLDRCGVAVDDFVSN